MSAPTSCPRTLSLIEMICVFDAATLATRGFGFWSAAPPHGLNRRVSLGPMGALEVETISAPLARWRMKLKLLFAPLAQKSQVPTVFCVTFFGFGPMVALYV